MAQGGKPGVGVVEPQPQAKLRPGGEHPVRLVGAAAHQVVDQNADVRLVATQDHRGLAAHPPDRVDPRHDPLRRRLLVARGAIDLAGEKESLDPPHLQTVGELGGNHRVVLHRVARADNLRPLQPRDGAHQRHLHIHGERGGEAVHVHLTGIHPLRLEEELVARATGKAEDLVLDRRTVARPHPPNLAVEQGRAVDVRGDQGMGRRGRVGDVTGELGALDPLRLKGEGGRLRIPGLDQSLVPPHGATVQPRAGPGLQTNQPQAKAGEGGGELAHRLLPDPAARPPHRTGVQQAIEEGAGGHHDRVGTVLPAKVSGDPDDPPRRDAHRHHPLLLHVEPRLGLEDRLHPMLVGILVRLGADRLDRLPLRGVEHAKLDTSGVGYPPHLAAEGVDLAHQVALANAADRRVARHQGDGVEREGEAGGARPHARRRQGRLATGVARPHHDHLVGRRMDHGVAGWTGALDCST